MRLNRLSEYELTDVRAHSYPDRNSVGHKLLELVAKRQPVSHLYVDEQTEHNSRSLMELWEQECEHGDLELVQRPQLAPDGRRVYVMGRTAGTRWSTSASTPGSNRAPTE